LFISVCGPVSVNCDSREVQNTPLYRCGDCAYDPVGNKCVSICPEFWVRNSTTGACQEASCSLRVPDKFVYFSFLFLILYCFIRGLTASLCGPNCVALNDSTCGDVCDPFHIPNEITKVFFFF
jgi:hypothetical protein